MPTKNKAVNTKLRDAMPHTVSLDYEEELSNSKKTSKPTQETQPTATLEKAEKICKLIATFIIIISATFHFYRLFRYGNNVSFAIFAILAYILSKCSLGMHYTYYKGFLLK